MTWKRHDCRFNSLAAKNLRQMTFTLSINLADSHQRRSLTAGWKGALTVGTCLAESRTRRRASRRRAAQRVAGNSESGSSPAGSTSVLGTDCAARSTWVCCQAEMSVSQSITAVLGTRIGRATHSLLGILRLRHVRVPSVK